MRTALLTYHLYRWLALFPCSSETEKVLLDGARDDSHPFLGLAFKLEVATHNNAFTY